MPARDNVLEFQADLKAFAKQVDLELQLVVKRTVIDLLRRIIQRTPVDTGRAAGSWTLARGTPLEAVLPVGTYGKPDAMAAAVAAANAVSFNPPEAVFWIANSLEYIEVLEFGLYPGAGPKTVAGFSIQAPQGMARVSLAETEADLFEAGGAPIGG